MKIRNGFVSNSSSSSFIIAIARVVDEDKLNTYIKKNNITNVEIEAIGDIKHWYNINIKDNKIKLESFMSDVETTFKDETDKVVIFDDAFGDDDDFWNGDDYDYDIDLDFFTEKIINTFEMFNKKDIGIEDSDYTYGAGRDG